MKKGQEVGVGWRACLSIAVDMGGGHHTGQDMNGALACPVVLCRGPRCSVQGRRPSTLVQDMSDGALACPTQWTWAEAIIQDKL